jgi:hypothetical protein
LGRLGAVGLLVESLPLLRLLTSSGELSVAQAAGKVPRDIDARQWQLAGAAFQRWDAQWRMPGTWTPGQVGRAVRDAAGLHERLWAGSIGPEGFTAQMTALVRRVGADGRKGAARGSAEPPRGERPAGPGAPPSELAAQQPARHEVAELEAALQAHRAQPRAGTRAALNDRLAQLTRGHRQQGGSWGAPTRARFAELSAQARAALAQPLAGQRGSEAVQALGRAIRAHGEAPGPGTRAQMNHALAWARSLHGSEGAGWTPATRADWAVYGPQAARALGGGARAAPGAPPQPASRTHGNRLREVSDQSPEAREARERERWQQAHEQAKLIQQQEGARVKLRAPTVAEHADRTARIADPWVRHLLEGGPELRTPDGPGAGGVVRSSARPGSAGGVGHDGQEPAATGSRAGAVFGVMPPARSSNWALQDLDPERVLQAMRQFEALPHPVSGPEQRYPADPIFENVFRGLTYLETDGLTHEDLSRLVRWVVSPKVHWGDRVTLSTARDHPPFELIRPQDHFQWHDWHIVTGFRSEPAGARLPNVAGPVRTEITAGHGGESGLVAWLTSDVAFNPRMKAETFRARSLRVWESKLNAAARTPPLSFTEQFPQLTGELTEATRLLRAFHREGYFGDAAHTEFVWPLISQLGSLSFFHQMGPNASRSHEDAARQLLTHLDDRAASARGGVPVHAAAAELQWTEAFRGFLIQTNPELDVRQVFNFVDFHRFYREQHDRGLLISPDEVRTWLREKNFQISD